VADPARPFGRSAAVYDLIYEQALDYDDLAARVHELVQRRHPGAASLLEAACGTGLYLSRLHANYRVAGFDVSPEMLAVARGRLPGVSLQEADMTNVDLERRFDAVVCLFSSIGYVGTVDRLRQTLAGFARHLEPGGVAIVEAWFHPEQFIDGHVSGEVYRGDGIAVARVNNTRVRDGMSEMTMGHLVATPEGIEHFEERHELGLFTDAEYREAFAAAGFRDLEHDPEGFIGRSVYSAVV
jgi:SAM-dependent methyltransferase